MIRRLRATLMLRLVILVACVLSVAGMFALGAGDGLWIAVVIAVLIWFVGIEIGLLPWWIERVLTRFAGRAEAPVDSLWFVDLDREPTEREQFHDDSRDNPTIR